MFIKLLREALGRVIVFINFITLPNPIQRSKEKQNSVDQEVKKISLYQFYGCPFCVKVRRVSHRLNINLEFRDAQKEGVFRKELQEEGGRIQVPCLKIEKDNRIEWLYESKEIINYLNKQFSSVD